MPGDVRIGNLTGPQKSGWQEHLTIALDLIKNIIGYLDGHYLVNKSSIQRGQALEPLAVITTATSHEPPQQIALHALRHVFLKEIGVGSISPAAPCGLQGKVPTHMRARSVLVLQICWPERRVLRRWRQPALPVRGNQRRSANLHGMRSGTVVRSRSKKRFLWRSCSPFER